MQINSCKKQLYSLYCVQSMAESQRRTEMYGQATVEGTGGSRGFAAKKSARWAGRVTSALVAAFLLFAGAVLGVTLGGVGGGRGGAGRVPSALVAAFLLFDGGIKVMMLEPAVEGSVQLGYPEGTVFGIGLALLVTPGPSAAPRPARPG